MIEPLLDHRSYMLEAVRLASRLSRRPWPNPPVGALVVRDDGVVVGRGSHDGPGTAHAEVVALEQAGAAARGSTLYCTLEPCNHEGRTPPCTPRVIASGIRHLVVGIRDANPAVTGGGLDLIRRAGIGVTLGVGAREALDLAWPFVVTRAFQRPYVALKTATSIDGRFAPSRDPGVTGLVYLTSVAARREVHRMRRWADLVLVGSGTILEDRPMLDGRLLGSDADCPAADPAPAYVDTDLSANMSWTGRRHVVFGGLATAPADRVRAVEGLGGRVVLCAEAAGRVDPASLVAHLADCGASTVLLEGGPTLAHSFLAADCVDRWVSFVAPLVLGEGPTWPRAMPDVRGAGLEAGSTEPFSAMPDGRRAGLEVCSTFSASRFHLTECGQVGGDARIVFDRLSFDETLQALTTMRGD